MAFPFLASLVIVPGDWLRLPSLAAALAVLLLFLLRDPLIVLWRARKDSTRADIAIQGPIARKSLWIFSIGLIIAGSVLFITLPAIWVLMLGVCGLAMVIGTTFVALERVQRQVAFQVLSVAGLTASCFPAYLAVHRELDWISLTFWAMSASHSISGVLLVRARLEIIVATRRAVSSPVSGPFARAARLWLISVGAVLLVLAMAGYPGFTLPLLIPLGIHSRQLLQIKRGKGLQTTMQSVGWTQLATSALFYAIAIGMFRSGLILYDNQRIMNVLQ